MGGLGGAPPPSAAAGEDKKTLIREVQKLPRLVREPRSDKMQDEVAKE